MTTTAPPPSPRLWVVALLLGAVLADLAASLWMAQQSHRWLPVAASAAAGPVDDLFALEVGIGSFIFLGCSGVMLWTLLFNRAPKYDLDNGDPIEGNLKLEITWTLIPLVIVMLIAWKAIAVSDTLATLGGKVRVTGGHAAMHGAEGPAAVAMAADEPGAASPIQVIGRQWSWEFIYPNGVHSSELHLPEGQRSVLRLEATDVIHGFYVPAFRLKQDLIPGSVIDYSLIPTRAGRYRLRDSMFSGGYFASNQTDVVVEPPEAYEAWLAQALGQPLRPAANAATDLYAQRLARGNRGWATVPPAAPPLVHVSADPTASHEG
ncbi:cytochrome c oxidase subunit II [Cyanobium sp. NIES-981]|uniref:cytochrome c oxidase subunit II n=1 Tax=Cyanobium sp. NIES-981 TaxID=1851505 RepID=UPI0007DDA73E|nr:cytochrome c oxidase subunit II [Cyanobium sp. NIES-981]SBO41756.1 Cytochrome c oxidase subunit 2 [Cyanobium sp. NIES-981]